MTNGGDFGSMQFLASSVFGQASYVEFQLLNAGVVVLTGSVANNGYCCGYSTYLGFSGGAFDEVRLQDGNFSPWYTPPSPTFSANDDNLLAIDNIAAVGPSAIPLPATLPLFASGLAALGLLGWRRKRQNAAIAA